MRGEQRLPSLAATVPALARPQASRASPREYSPAVRHHIWAASCYACAVKPGQTCLKCRRAQLGPDFLFHRF